MRSGRSATLPALWKWFAPATAFAVASLLVVSTVSARGPRQATTITVVVDRAPVLVAPVADAPVAIELNAGESFESEAEVNGEEIGGNARWHLITVALDPDLVRGFVHSSLVAAAQ